jgi:putative ABC transport system permease protein
VEIADRIDANFANSRFETETTTEKAFLQSWADQIGNIGAILTAVLTVVFFTILLVAGNTMAQAVRERTSELAVLKTLGFSRGAVLRLVLAESLLLNCFGGGVGLLLGWLFVGAVDPLLSGMLNVFTVPTEDFAIGIGVALMLGVACGLPPALRAMRLQIVDGLRRV